MGGFRKNTPLGVLLDGSVSSMLHPSLVGLIDVFSESHGLEPTKFSLNPMEEFSQNQSGFISVKSLFVIIITGLVFANLRMGLCTSKSFGHADFVSNSHKINLRELGETLGRRFVFFRNLYPMAVNVIAAFKVIPNSFDKENE